LDADRALPSAVRGPVDRRAFPRFAAIWWSVDMCVTLSKKKKAGIPGQSAGAAMAPDETTLTGEVEERSVSY
jgi:hypothetical protein